MKIALLTFHDTTNFGSLLQTFGLFYTLNKMGYEVEILDYQCSEIRKRELVNLVVHDLSMRKIISHIIRSPLKLLKQTKMRRFLKENMKISKSYNRSNIVGISDIYDAFLVGSDILWDPKITGTDKTYMLDFIKQKTKKYSFSTSVGSEWSIREKEIFIPLLQDFCKISVREEETSYWLSDNLEVNVPITCDPTMLVEIDYWINLAVKRGRMRKYNYLIVYFPDGQGKMIQDAILYSKKKHIEVLVINYGKKYKGVKNIAPCSIEQFLSLLYYSDAVFTASYHGFLFALYFSKQLYYYNLNSPQHKNRFDTIRHKFNINIIDQSNYDNLQESELDFGYIHRKMKDYRKESLDILGGYWN